MTVGAFGFFYYSKPHFSTEYVKAGTGDNVSGFAWSENIGWINFNNTSGGGAVNYGVNIDPATGNLSGFAWSENIGWISFAPAGPYPEAPDYSAKLDTTTNGVTGWARACAGAANADCTGGANPLAGGWDGWIKMSGVAADGNPYGVSRSVCDLTGYAWGSDVMDWIKFKGVAQDGAPYGVTTTFCGIINSPPSATDLQVSQPDYCFSGPGGIFSWVFSGTDVGGNQSAYQVQIDNNSGFTSPEDDSGKVISSSNSYATPLGKLSYNTNYYWRLKVWDSRDAASSWIEYNDPADPDGDGNSRTFTTPVHEYPGPNISGDWFNWSPYLPTANEDILFADQTQVYGVAAKSSWLWNFQNASPTASTLQNPTVEFLFAGNMSATLKITDSDGFSCTSPPAVIRVQLPLPEWEEIPPF